MSDLATFGEHARAMSTAEHKPECSVLVSLRWSWRQVHPDPDCSGCVTDADRALWGRLADEVDAYLTVDHGEGLLA